MSTMLPAKANTARSTFTAYLLIEGLKLKSRCPAPRALPAILTIYTIIRIYATMKLNINDMLAAADEASALLKALSNRHRLIIVCQLVEKAHSVGELAALLNI